MRNLELPFFGKIKIEPISETYNTKFDFNGSNLELTLSFYDFSIYCKNEDKLKKNTQTIEIFKKVKSSLENLFEFEKNNRERINEEFKISDSSIYFFLQVCFRELKNEISHIIDINITEIENLKILKRHLKLTSVRFYPKAEDTDYINFEYRLIDNSSYTLNVYYDNQQKITGVNYSIPFETLLNFTE